MLHIATLTANPKNPVIEPGLLAKVSAVLPGARPPVVLAPGIAAEIPFTATGIETRDLAGIARIALEGAAADLNLLPAEERRKGLLLADMDSTMIEQECLDELADLVGLKEHVAAITERTMRGELEFEPALRERVALLKGLKLDRIGSVIDERISLMPGGRVLVATMRAHGARTALVSGGFTLFTAPIATRIGFDEQRGNVLDHDGSALSGTVSDPILGRDAKRAALIELRGKLKLTASQTLAVGDGANDLAMLEEAGLGVAFRAKPAVSAAAGARIEYGDLTALLYLQGYRKDEFVTSAAL
ncbi:phosphoserine phosphatase SerB [Terrihabitans soli]|uniref:Phosphoserine phosphatase n=1 Tax=Terrihabitans soli TaxID=708113 RepID=A0A6S6QWF1_9HYPH|nr:phosphoserine phosphatase SerB [Terrihabitans soli]BCJ91381.1 phosphoserine phosphatase SerB [Terrihabitans soli]